MGHNVDLCRMINAPKTVICPECGKETATHCDDYDIECGNPNPGPGFWRLSFYCEHCEHEWNDEYEVDLTPVGATDD